MGRMSILKVSDGYAGMRKMWYANILNCDWRLLAGPFHCIETKHVHFLYAWLTKLSQVIFSHFMLETNQANHIGISEAINVHRPFMTIPQITRYALCTSPWHTFSVHLSPWNILKLDSWGEGITVEFPGLKDYLHRLAAKKQIENAGNSMNLNNLIWNRR